MNTSPTCLRGAKVCALVGTALCLLAARAHAVPLITEFAIYGARNVFIGDGTIVGTPSSPVKVAAGNGTIGVGDADLNGNAGVYGDLLAGDDVSLSSGLSSFVTGTITNPGTFTPGNTTYGAHVVAMPALPALPAPTVFSHGVTNQSVGNGATMNLAPGSYADISLGGAATLNLSAGDYYLKSVTAANGLELNVNLAGGNLRLFITEDFNVGGIMTMGLTGGGANNVYAEVHASGLNAFRVGGGSGTQWRGNVFAPFGDIHLGSGSSANGVIEGYLWSGRDVDLEHGLDYFPPVPEPSSFVLLAAGFVALAIGLRRRRARRA